MTSVPKPLKFLREHYPSLKIVYDKIQDAQTKKFCADVVSVLAMGVSGSTVSINHNFIMLFYQVEPKIMEINYNWQEAAEKRECLKYCLLGTMSNVGDWGHEYVRYVY